MKVVRVDINPHILRWARERSRFSRQELAKRMGVNLDRYIQWESGEGKPTLRQLYKLVRITNRSLQLFFMDKPPQEPEFLAEMRRLPDSSVGAETPELAEQVLLAIQKRDIALRLFHDLGETPASFNISADLDDDIDKVASSVRETLGITIDEQNSWSDPYEAIREWRSALEGLGVLVFQIPGVAMSEMRGFSLSFRPLPIIGFNSKDSPRGRIFTVFHELTHIVLDENVLDTVDKSWFQLDSEFRVERFCNRVAAATLVPTTDILRQVRLTGKSPGEDWTDHDVATLSIRYKVSRAVIIRRLSNLNLISKSSFEILRSEYDEFPRERPSSSGGDFYANKMAHFGTLIPRLAFQAYYDNQATVSDLSMLLGMKSKNLGKFEEKIQGFSYGFRSS